MRATALREKAKKILLHLIFGVVDKEIKNNIKMVYNGVHNILRLFDILPNFSYNASQMRRD